MNQGGKHGVSAIKINIQSGHGDQMDHCEGIDCVIKNQLLGVKGVPNPFMSEYYKSVPYFEGVFFVVVASFFLSAT